jgi:hypothetical protein
LFQLERRDAPVVRADPLEADRFKKGRAGLDRTRPVGTAMVLSLQGKLTRLQD